MPTARPIQTKRVRSSIPRPAFDPTLVVVGTALFISLALVGSFRLLRAGSILAHPTATPILVRAYEHFCTFKTALTDISITGTAGPIQTRIYTPIGVRNPAPIVLVHGFAPNGNRDDGLNESAANLARVGFLVVVPTIPGEAHFKMLPSDLLVIRDVVSWTAHATNQQVSLFGISFGGGLVVPAAVQPSIAGDVKLLVCFSGFTDLNSIGRYFIHDRVNDPFGHPYSGQPPGPLLITSPYLDELVPAGDASALAPAIDRFDRNRGRSLPKDDPILRSLGSKQRREFNELESVTKPQTRQLYLDVLARHRAEIAAISPSSVLKSLKIPMFVLHGTNDSVFPEGEVEWMRKETAGKPDVHILVTPWISHAEIGDPTTPWEKLRTLIFCAEMLRRVDNKVFLVH